MDYSPSLVESIVGLLCLLAVLAALLSLIFRSPKPITVEALYANPLDRLKSRQEPTPEPVKAGIAPVQNVPVNLEVRGPAKSGARKYPGGSAEGGILLGARKGPRVRKPKKVVKK